MSRSFGARFPGVGILGLTAMLALGACGPTGDNAAWTANSAAPGNRATETLAKAPSVSDYRIMRDDILQIFVYQVADFNREAQVDAAGNIAMPLLGAIPAAGRTTRELESDIARRLRVKYVQDPQVAVTVKDAVGLRVTVTGAVLKPGVLQLRGSMSLSNALAQAGGFSDTADHSNVLIFRGEGAARSSVRFDGNAILDGTAPDPQILPGDTIVVDDSVAKSAWKQSSNALGIASIARLLY